MIRLCRGRYLNGFRKVDFGTFCTTAGVSKQFSRPGLTFGAGGTTVTAVPFGMGKGDQGPAEDPGGKGGAGVSADVPLGN